METQAECWQALLDGKTLVNEARVELYLKEGNLTNTSGYGVSGVSFYVSDKWSIKPETKTITKEQLRQLIDESHIKCNKTEYIWEKL